MAEAAGAPVARARITPDNPCVAPGCEDRTKDGQAKRCPKHNGWVHSRIKQCMENAGFQPYQRGGKRVRDEDDEPEPEFGGPVLAVPKGMKIPNGRRSIPAICNEIYLVKAARLDPVDCELESNDDDIKKARRTKNLTDGAATLEYKVFGNWKVDDDEWPGVPDTHWVKVYDLIFGSNPAHVAAKINEFEARYKTSAIDAFNAAMEAFEESQSVAPASAEAAEEEGEAHGD